MAMSVHLTIQAIAQDWPSADDEETWNFIRRTMRHHRYDVGFDYEIAGTVDNIVGGVGRVSGKTTGFIVRVTNQDEGRTVSLSGSSEILTALLAMGLQVRAESVMPRREVA